MGTVIFTGHRFSDIKYKQHTSLQHVFQKQRFQLVWFSAFSQRTQAGIIWWVFISCYPLLGFVLEIEEENPLGICYLIVNAQHKVMLLMFHVPLPLLVNTGPRVHFVSVLHDSSVQSGPRERCTVFFRHETRHLRPLSGDYLNSWHSSWAA